MTPPRYAILFKTHFWDDFAARQVERYRQAAKTGTVFVCLDDESGNAGAVDAPLVLRATHADFAALGLSRRYERGNMLWWNTDYFHYLFQDRYPGFDYILAVEYDTTLLGDIDAFVAEAQARGADMVGLPIRTPLSKWMWTRYHVQTYPAAALRASLNCISLFSNRAVAHLLERRRAMSSASAAAGVPFWPGNEVFLRTEIEQAGYRFLPLDEFGDATRYEWHPPHLEEDLPARADRPVFVHPVLDRPRYITSQLRFASDLPSFFRPDSDLRRDLARFPEPEWRPQLVRAAWARLRMRARERMQGLAARLQLAIGAS